MSFTDDEHPIGAFAPDGATPAFGERVRPAAWGGVLMISMPVAVNTVSEATVKRGVAVAQQEPHAFGSLVQVHQDVSGLLGVWVPKTRPSL